MKTKSLEGSTAQGILEMLKERTDETDEEILGELTSLLADYAENVLNDRAREYMIDSGRPC